MTEEQFQSQFIEDDDEKDERRRRQIKQSRIMKDSITPSKPEPTDECKLCGKQRFAHYHEIGGTFCDAWNGDKSGRDRVFTPKEPDATPSKEAKHTAGPWTVNYDYNPATIQANEGRQDIAEVFIPTKDNAERIANAELIARAPLLLQENATLRERIAHYKGEAENNADENKELRERNRVLEEALNAARKSLRLFAGTNAPPSAYAEIHAVLSRNESKTPNEE